MSSTNSTDEELVPADLTLENGAPDGDGNSDAADGDWSETFGSPKTAATRSDDDLPDIDARNSLPQTLRHHLLWQMQMTPFSDDDKPIALAIIDAINDEGYLSCTLEEIQQALAKGGIQSEIDEIEAVLHQLQNYDPGV